MTSETTDLAVTGGTWDPVVAVPIGAFMLLIVAFIIISLVKKR